MASMIVAEPVKVLRLGVPPQKIVSGKNSVAVSVVCAEHTAAHIERNTRKARAIRFSLRQLDIAGVLTKNLMLRQ